MTFHLHLLSPFASTSVQGEITIPKLLKGQGAKATSDLILLRSSHRNLSPCHRAQERTVTAWRKCEKSKQLHTSFSSKH